MHHRRLRRLSGLVALAASALATPLAASDRQPDSYGDLPAAVASSSDAAELDRRALARIANPPLGLPAVPVPEGNPPTTAKIRLGRKLLFDRRLSRNGTMSCAMCHVPEQGFTNNELKTAVGIEGKSLLRNAPTLLNTAYAAPFFHDGREPELDLQPFDVFLHPDEMAAPSLGAVVAKVRALPDYQPFFQEAFGGPATVDSIGQAIGTYARTLLSGNSPFDRWYFGGESDAMSATAKRGFRLFAGKANCATCHTIETGAALFTDHRFHDTSLGRHNSMVESRSTEPVKVELAPGVYTHLERSAVASVGEPRANDLGRYEVTLEPADRWLFKTPTLRNVALTAPYMHDGSFSTLRVVVEFYDQGGFPHDGLDPQIEPLGLDDGEIDDLVAFLQSLTGDNLEELIRDARSQRIGNPGAAAGEAVD
jgi:cytochrome c peroxidase